MAIGEFELIRRYFARPMRGRGGNGAGVMLGIGDDAAALRADGPVWSAHAAWRAKTADEDAVGVAQALTQAVFSTLHRAGARPRWLLLGLTIQARDEQWVASFSAALAALTRVEGATLVGGDTTRGALAIDLFCLGPGPGPGDDDTAGR